MLVEFKEGKKHSIADALFRLTPCGQCQIKHQEPKQKRDTNVFETGDDVEKCEYSEQVMNRIHRIQI